MSGGTGKTDPYYRPAPKSLAKERRTHTKRPKRVEVEEKGRKKYVFDCPKCGNEFKTESRRPRTYCGEDCRRKAFGELATSRKGEKRTPEAIRKIRYGQKEAWAKKGAKEKRSQSMRGIEKSKPHWREGKYKFYTYTCTECGIVFETRRKKTGVKKFHNTDCRDQWQRENQKGRASDFWRGGWSEWINDSKLTDGNKERIRRKDNYECQSCSRKRKKGDCAFPVHHILPRSLGGPDEEWNLITLCPSCHRKTDAQGGPVRYPHETQSKLENYPDASE